MMSQRVSGSVFQNVRALVILILLPLTSSLAVASDVSCESVFSGSISESPVATASVPPRELINGGTLITGSVHDFLLVKTIPKFWVGLFKSEPNVQITLKESSVRRISVTGQAYTAYYAKWTPTGRTPLATIILHHGFTRSSRYFHDMVVLLTHLGYEVIAPDGVNIGSTLAMSHSELSGGYVKDPVPLDDANTVREIVNVEGLKEFAMLGHSRGHAVTALVAAMPEMQDRIIHHFAVNPYIQWISDYHIDQMNDSSRIHQVAKIQRSLQGFTGLGLLNPFSGLADMMDRSQLQSMRSATNALSMVTMAKFINMALDHRQPHEIVHGVSSLENPAAMRIAIGLRGQNPREAGFDTRPFYGVEDPDNKGFKLKLLDNGFGYDKFELSEISDRVKSVTTAVYGRRDDTVTPPMMTPLLSIPGVKAVEFKDGNHYIPSEMPFSLVNLMHMRMQESLRARHHDAK